MAFLGLTGGDFTLTTGFSSIIATFSIASYRQNKKGSGTVDDRQSVEEIEDIDADAAEQQQTAKSTHEQNSLDAVLRDDLLGDFYPQSRIVRYRDAAVAVDVHRTRQQRLVERVVGDVVFEPRTPRRAGHDL